MNTTDPLPLLDLWVWTGMQDRCLPTGAVRLSSVQALHSRLQFSPQLLLCELVRPVRALPGSLSSGLLAHGPSSACLTHDAHLSTLRLGLFADFFWCLFHFVFMIFFPVAVEI